MPGVTPLRGEFAHATALWSLLMLLPLGALLLAAPADGQVPPLAPARSVALEPAGAPASLEPIVVELGIRFAPPAPPALAGDAAFDRVSILAPEGFRFRVGGVRVGSQEYDAWAPVYPGCGFYDPLFWQGFWSRGLLTPPAFYSCRSDGATQLQLSHPLRDPTEVVVLRLEGFRAPTRAGDYGLAVQLSYAAGGMDHALKTQALPGALAGQLPSYPLTFTVRPAALDHVRFTLAPEATDADTSVLFAAQAEDVFGNVRGDPVSFALAAGSGSVEPEGRFRPVKVGTSVVRAGAGDKGALASVAVTPGAPHHLRIEDPRGEELQELQLTTDDLVPVSARDYDQHDNLIGPVAARWRVEGGVGFVLATQAADTTFNPTRVGTGRVVADHPLLPGAVDDATGPVAVRPGRLAALGIFLEPQAQRPALGSIALTTDDALSLHAAGLDADGNFVEARAAEWGVRGGLDPFPPGPASTVTFSPRTAGVTGFFTALDTAAGLAAKTGLVSVRPGALAALVVTGAPASAEAGEGFGGVAVEARDADGNRKTDYAGTVRFRSSDAKATLPASYAFTAQDSGVHTFPGFALRTSRPDERAQTLTAADDAAGVRGMSTPVGVIPGPMRSLELSLLFEATREVSPGGTTSVTATAKDAFGNPLLAGTVVSWVLVPGATNEGTASLSGSQVLTDDLGEASVQLTASLQAGDFWRLKAADDPDVEAAEVKATSGKVLVAG